MSLQSTSTTKDTTFYRNVFGVIIGVGLVAYLWSKYNKNVTVQTTAMEKKQLEDISKQPPKVSSDIGTPLNSSAFDEPKITVAPDKTPDLSNSVNSIRDNAFQLGAEDIAQPMDIQQKPVGKLNAEAKPAVKPVVKPVAKAPVNNYKLPPNAYVGAAGDAQGLFSVNDVVWSNRDQKVKLARVLGGDFTEVDDIGKPLGFADYKHRQKLGVIHSMAQYGAFIKLAPDFKKYGYVDYRGMFKMV